MLFVPSNEKSDSVAMTFITGMVGWSRHFYTLTPLTLPF